MSTAEKPSTRTLNGILLERQWLSRQFQGTPLQLIESHGVIQTQERHSGEEYLRSRGATTAKALDELRSKGEVVKATLHRCTVHTLARDDFQRWQPLYADKLEQMLERKGWKLKENWRTEVEVILGDGSYRAKDLRELLHPLFPYGDMEFLVRGFIGLVRVPGENGVDLGGRELFTVPAGLRRHSPEELLEAKRDLVRRYLASFGPARASDFTSWSGLTGATEVFKSLGDELWRGKDETNKTLYDLTHLSRETSSSVPRYLALPQFDNSVLAYGERARIADFTKEERASFFDSAMAPLLVNGKTVAKWINRVNAGKTRLLLKEIKPVAPNDKRKLEEKLVALISPERQFTGELKWTKSFVGA